VLQVYLVLVFGLINWNLIFLIVLMCVGVVELLFGVVVVWLWVGDCEFEFEDGMIFVYEELLVVIGVVFWSFFGFDCFDNVFLFCMIFDLCWFGELFDVGVELVVVGVGFIGFEVVVMVCVYGV